MSRIDLKRELKELYQPPTDEVVVVDVPEMQFLMIDGKGHPNTGAGYQTAVNALYAVAYAIRFALKEEAQTAEYVVPPLERLWWTEDASEDASWYASHFSLDNKEDGRWTMMIMQPDWVTQDHVTAAVEEAKLKKQAPSDDEVRTALDEVRLEPYKEGKAAQTMYVGPYADEAPTIEALHDFIRDHGYTPRGKHHEIYINDPRRTKPDKLKTVIRQPVD